MNELITWRRYLLKEGEKEFFPWLEELKYDPIRFLRKHVSNGTTDVMGKGSFRMVIAPEKDSDVVVKILKNLSRSNPGKLDKQYAYMNKAEKLLADEFPLLFPRVYSHDQEYTWIVSQRLHSDGTDEMLSEGMMTTFPDILEESRSLCEKMGLMFVNDRDIFRFIVMGISYAVKRRGLGMFDKTDDRVPVIKALPKIALREEWMMQLAKAIHRYDLEVQDLKPANLGLDNHSNLKILDASVFGVGLGEVKWSI